ncbi:MAG TPA: AAA family ATPase, partial [Pseudomonadota bacterium]|nr:AAA family ATPase [Pseudomonadota bacterium]
MFLVEYRALLKRLNPLCTKALEAAASLAISRSHFEIGVEHFLAKILEEPSGDASAIFRALSVSGTPLLRAIHRGSDQRKRGNSGRPVFSPILVSLIQDAWLLSSVEGGDNKIRSGYLLLTLLLQPERYGAAEYAELLSVIDRDALRRRFAELTAGSSEIPLTAPEAEAGEARSTASPAYAAAAEDSALGKFTYDLTARARAGKIDPVLGRDREIRQLLDILGRRQKNNPIIVGESGVGKTALVEGLALRIADKDVPPSLLDVEVRSLDMGLLQAGAGVKGEFEARLTAVIGEVKASPRPIILFIDEAHTMIGAGASAGGSDAANLLKPALARGELRTIAATTWSEYKKYFEKDAALSRRFQPVKVEEPSREVAIDMLRGLAVKLQAAHGVHICDEAVVTAVDLSRRYISGRLLPDKAVDLLDTCAARVKLGLSTRPAELEALSRTVESIDRERSARREDLHLSGQSALSHPSLGELSEALAMAEQKRDELAARWQAESQVAQEILTLRQKLAQKDKLTHDAHAAVHTLPVTTQGQQPQPGETVAAENTEVLAQALAEALPKLRALQQEIPLVTVEVDPETVAKVVADWTGIPVGKMVRDDVAATASIEDRLMKRIRGQDAAICAIARRLRNAKAGLQDPRQPLGVFLLVGPSGTGKTETALSVADLLFGGERFMVTINMSEFQ